MQKNNITGFAAMLRRLCLPAVFVMLMCLLSLPASAAVTDDFPEIFGAGLVIQAHRGFSDQYPENTLPAFEAAAKNSMFRAMETDLQMTADHVIVCCHDETIDRTTDGTGNISDYTYAELQKFHINDGFGWTDEYAGKLTIPTLEDFLRICRENGKIPYLELKENDHALTDELLTILSRDGWQRKCVLLSFSLEAMEYVSSKTGEYPLEYMPYNLDYLDTLIVQVQSLRNGIIRPRYSNLTAENAAHIRAAGLEIEAWTIPVGDSQVMQEVIDLGVVGVACNNANAYNIDDAVIHVDRDDEQLEQQETRTHISTCSLTCEDVAYERDAVLPQVSVTSADGKLLKEGRDYTIEGEMPLDVGLHTITVTGAGNYYGINEVSFQVTPRDITAVACAPIVDQTFTGLALCPNPALDDGGAALQLGQDYTVDWENNTHIGTATMYIFGKGNYSGTFTREFQILPATMGGVQIHMQAAGLRCNGKAQYPPVELTNGDILLTEGEDYTIVWVNNTWPGEAAAVFRGMGDYTGEISESFHIGYPVELYYAGEIAVLVILLVVLMLLFRRRRKQAKARRSGDKTS